MVFGGMLRPWSKAGAVTALLVGLAALVGAAIGVSETVRAKAANDVYNNARPCPAGTPWSADCVLQVPATVSGAAEKSRRYNNYLLHVVAADGRHDIDFPGPNAVVRSARDGDPVMLTVWRGGVRMVTRFGASAETTDPPVRAIGAAAVVTLALLGLAAICFTFSGLYFRDARELKRQSAVRRS